MIDNHWQFRDAKNKFSKLVDKALRDGPQIVTRHGKDTVVVLSVDEYRKLIKHGTSLIQFFQTSPLAENEIDLSKTKEIPREEIEI